MVIYFYMDNLILVNNFQEFPNYYLKLEYHKAAD